MITPQTLKLLSYLLRHHFWILSFLKGVHSPFIVGLLFFSLWFKLLLVFWKLFRHKFSFLVWELINVTTQLLMPFMLFAEDIIVSVTHVVTWLCIHQPHLTEINTRKMSMGWACVHSGCWCQSLGFCVIRAYLMRLWQQTKLGTLLSFCSVFPLLCFSRRSLRWFSIASPASEPFEMTSQNAAVREQEVAHVTSYHLAMEE